VRFGVCEGCRGRTEGIRGWKYNGSGGSGGSRCQRSTAAQVSDGDGGGAHALLTWTRIMMMIIISVTPSQISPSGSAKNKKCYTVHRLLRSNERLAKKGCNKEEQGAVHQT
jgi:hypothetical protein